MRLIIPGQPPRGITAQGFESLSIKYAGFLAASLLYEDLEDPHWPLRDNANTVLGAIWSDVAASSGIPGAVSHQPDNLSLEVMRNGNHLIALMLLPGFSGCVCFTAGLWLIGPVDTAAADPLVNAVPRFFLMAEDRGRSGEAKLFEAISGSFEEKGALSVADARLFLTTVVQRYLGGSNVVVWTGAGDTAMADAMDRARSLVSYFVDILNNYPTVREYSVKVRIEDEAGAEYFWLEDTVWQDGEFRGTIGNEPVRVRSVAVGQPIRVAPESVCDWYYMWEGKIRGNYTLRASLPYMDPEQAAKARTILADD